MAEVNAMEKLAREISRVTRVMQHYEWTVREAKEGRFPALSPYTESLVLPHIKLQLEQAFRAAGSGEALDVVNALNALKTIE